MHFDEMKTVRRYTLIVGAKDKDTKEMSAILKTIKQEFHENMKESEIGFSTVYQKGGYQGNDGEYVFESSFSITLLGVSEETMKSVAEFLCKELNQESILITKEDVEICSLNFD